MQFFNEILRSFYEYASKHLNTYGAIIIVLFILLSVTINKKRKVTPFGLFLAAALSLLQIGITYILYRREIINLSLINLTILSSALSFLQVTEIIKNRFSPSAQIIINNSTYVLSIFTSIYSLFIINYFNNHEIIRYGLIITYFIYLIIFLSHYKKQLNFIRAHENIEEAYTIIAQSGGTKTFTLPLDFLLNSPTISLFNAFVIIFSIKKDKINAGIYDSRNRNSLITFNSDKTWYTSLLIICLTVLFSKEFSLESIYLSVLLIAIWPFIRKAGSSLTKYYTTITGEINISRPIIYDSMILRVLPDLHNGFLSNIYISRKKCTYSIFFHNHKFLADSKKGIIEEQKIVKSGHHLMLIFNKTDQEINFVCEFDLVSGLKSPIMIIDVWRAELELNVLGKMLFGRVTGDYYWLNKRIQVIQTLTDENFLEIEGEFLNHINTENQIKIAEGHLVRQNIVNSSSFESLRRNIELLEKNYSENDHIRLKNITGKGIYELNTLFRQLHESPSIPSRFIDLLNVAECMIRYLCGFCHAVKCEDQMTIDNGVVMDTKAIAYGNCNDFLARWLKNNTTKNDNLLADKINTFLNQKYDDRDNVKELIKFLRIMNPNPNVKYSNRPDILELNWWLSTIRNKTRGHGTPSKVNYRFYVALEKAVLFLISEFANMNINPCYMAEIEGVSWTFNLSNGGYPEPVPVADEHRKGIHINPFVDNAEFDRIISDHHKIIKQIPGDDKSLYLRVSNENTDEWWRCENHFSIKKGIVYILNQRSEKSESWISFSTGKIMRPEIVEDIDPTN